MQFPGGSQRFITATLHLEASGGKKVSRPRHRMGCKERPLVGALTCGQGTQPAQGDPQGDSWKTKYFNSSLLLNLGLARAPHWQSQQEAGGEVLNGCSALGLLPAQGGRRAASGSPGVNGSCPVQRPCLLLPCPAHKVDPYLSQG